MCDNKESSIKHFYLSMLPMEETPYKPERMTRLLIEMREMATEIAGPSTFNHDFASSP